MKKIITLTLILSLTVIKLSATGCLPNGIIFTSQAQIDNFGQQYNYCTEIEGNVVIHESTAGDITNLNGLSNITKIDGYLNIYTNSHLKYLTGLDNLTEIGGYLNLYNNDYLKNINALSNLTSVGEFVQIKGNDFLLNIEGLSGLDEIPGYLVIKDNPDLGNLSGLDNITEIGGKLDIINNDDLDNLSELNNLSSIGGELNISYNANLANLTGLSNLNSIAGYLNIYSNSSLSDISALSSLTSIDGFLAIIYNNNITSLDGLQNINPATIQSSTSGYDDINLHNNTSLSECEVLSICEVLNNGGSTDIHDNASGCDSEAEVTEACTPAECTSLTDPVDGETDVPINTSLTWATSAHADGYNLCVGYTQNCDIFNGDVGNVTTWDPPEDFNCGTQIHVLITPYNNSPYNTYCSYESFYTESVTASAGNDTEICSGSSTQLQASGGTIYSWYPTTGLDDPNIANPVASPNTTTTYTVTVSNDNGCSDTDDVTVFVNPKPIPNASATDETGNNFNDGTATCNPTSGTPGYTYNWSNGETTQTITGLTPGNYTVTVTDSKSCTADETVTVNEFICPELIIHYTQNDVTCFDECDGSISITAVDNGVPPFSYNWSDGQTTATIENLCAGEYTVTITDAKNCSVISDTYTITQPNPLSLTESHINVSCHSDKDGSIDLSVSGGTPDYSYNWNNGATSQDLVGIGAGTYTVTVTDDNACTDTLTIIITEPDILDANASSTDETAYGADDGTATSNPIGGTPPYTYQWSTGETAQSILFLAPDTYFVTVTDANSCSNTASVTVNPFICPNLEIQAILTHNQCNKDCEGSIEITDLINGTEPYTYLWSTGSTENHIDSLCAGIYTVTVTDANNCSLEHDYEITQPDALIPNASATDETSNGANDGTATCDPSGGTPPYSYSWSNGQNTQSITGLAPGNYTITVTDSLQCNAIQTVVVNSFGCPDLVVYSTVFDAGCYGGCNGSISITGVENSTPPLQYEWSNGATTPSITKLCAGEYNVTITDSLNCSIVSNYTIEQFDQLFVSITTEDVSSNGANDGSATANANGGKEPYSYNWSNGQNTQKITGLSPGTYIVTVVDANQCSIIDSCIINSFGCSGMNVLYDINNVSCYGNCDGNIIITNVQNANFPVTYNWSNGTDTSYVTDLCAGTYFLTITDNNSCTSIDTFTITQPDLLRIISTHKIDISDSIPEGQIQIEIAGGTQPYSFQWTGDNGYTSGNQNIYHLAEGAYMVTITDSNECTVQSDTIWIYDNQTATFDPENLGSVIIYPIPANDIIFIQFGDDISLGDIKIQLHSLSGEKISEYIANKTTALDIRTLSEGIYIMKIFSHKGTAFKKISIIR